MDHFVDSSRLAGDREALRARLAEDGCIFLPRLLDPEKVLALRVQILGVLDRCGWLADGSDPALALPGPIARQEGRDGWWDGYIGIQSLESFHELPYDEAFLGALRTLVADDAIPHPRKIGRVLYPDRPDFTTPAHQDYTHIMGTVDFVTCWVPLGDAGGDVGGLRVLRGSQNGALRPLHPAPGAGGVGIDVDDDDPAWATADYHAGDVLVFHSMSVHAGTPNRSRQLRLSADYRFQSASEPITTLSLHPHYWRQIAQMPDWPDLTHGWTTTRWIDALPMTVVDTPEMRRKPTIETLHEDLVVPVSRLVTAGHGRKPVSTA